MATRDLALETAHQRQMSVVAAAEISANGPVVHAFRSRGGAAMEISLSWPAIDGDFREYLIRHYRTHRRSEFEIDLSDGQGVRRVRYAEPPRFTAVGPRSVGSYSITIETSDIE